MSNRVLRASLGFLSLLLVVSRSANAISWFPFGPDGGDARSIAIDPHDHTHLFLGTTTGWIFESHTAGQEWKRLARIGQRDDLVLDNIVVDTTDPKHLLVGTFVVGGVDGGLFVSKDAGVTWVNQEGMRGQSVRSLAESVSNSKLWIAGTLTGVQQSEDNGEHWRQISPKDSTEIHEIESVAIDPVNPKVIYAGTWHLPWKTTDGGATWNNIKEGVIDDSDVFSIIVDLAHPNTVYASACSGIYKSDNAGDRFQKVEGIPSTARRTRVLMQDPKNPNIVFAGTTEGLWRTSDAGKIWLRMTGPEVIVNDVSIDTVDSNKMLVATDRGGVLYSNDGGTSFRPSNKGFSARHLSSFVSDAANPAMVYVGVLNDKQWGGVFASDNGGLSWAQKSDGLGGSDVFSLGQAPDGTILAGTGHGMYRLKDARWDRVADVGYQKAGQTSPSKGAAPGKAVHPAASKSQAIRRPSLSMKPFEGAVFGMARNGNSLFAASSQGLLMSADSGTTWKAVNGVPAGEFYYVTSAHADILAAGLTSMTLSKDEGQSWKAVTPPSGLSQMTAAAVDGQGGLWAAGREGVYLSQDDGASWQTLPGLFVNDVNSIFYDARADRVLITTAGKGTIAYAVHLPEKKVSFWDTGWSLRLIRPVGDHLLGVTPYDGVVLQPRMMESAESVRH